MAIDQIEVMDILDTAEAVRIGTGRAKVPRSWLELIEPDERERAKWRDSEFRHDSE